MPEPTEEEFDDFDLDDLLGDLPSDGVESPAAPAQTEESEEVGEETRLAELAEAAGAEHHEGEELARPAAPASEEETRQAADETDETEDSFEDEDVDLTDFLGSTGTGGEDVWKPWMKFHSFNLCKNIDDVRTAVDSAIEHGACGLDLETEGFDNRVDWVDGKPQTRHKIVGFCLSVRGVGYYMPIRHKFDPVYGESDPNLPAEAVEEEIRRLCQASQPVLTEEGQEEDPLGSLKLAEPPKVVIYFWNSKFDQEFLFPVTGIDFWHPASFEDGFLAAYCVYSDDKNLGLKAKSAQKLRIYEAVEGQDDPLEHPYEMIEFGDLFPKGIPKKEMFFADLYPEEGSPVVAYGCSDAICTEIICEKRKAREVGWAFKVKPKGVRFQNVVGPVYAEKKWRRTYRLEKQTTQAVRLMERTRTLIDKDEIDKLLQEADEELAAIDEEIKAQAEMKGFRDFNPSSPAQLGEFLFGASGLDIHPKPERTANGQFKTDASTLEKIGDATELPIISQFIKRRQIEKIVGTYLKGMKANTDEHNQLRFNFKQTGAATGRFTAPQGNADHGFSGIPIQGIPARDDPKKPKVARSLRRIFIAHPGYTMCKIDYSGQELRIVTNLSKEPVWMKEFLEGSGDLHTITAKAFFGDHITRENKLERGMGKIANFALIYGGGTQAIMRATKCDKVEAARKKAAFDKSVPVFAKWVKNQHGYVKRHKGVFTAFGRFISIPDANIKVGETDSNGVPVLEESMVRRIRAGCERKSTNYPIQGSGADILKISLVLLTKELTKRGWLKNGGDDSVRMIMTVHDEIVFEIKHERLQMALPIICKIMCSPSELVGWTVPLEVEPEIALSWAAKYDFLAIMRGEAPVPEWLEGHITPGAPPPELPEPPKRLLTPAQAPSEEPETVFTPQTSPDDVKPSETASEAAKAQGQEIVVFRVPRAYLTRESQRLVMKAIDGALPLAVDIGKPKFKLLRLLDQEGGVLIDTELNIRVDPERFAKELRERNLGQGQFTVVRE